ncbi:MAG: hypothetical protein MUC43_02945 [Pirellula sp.]|nr:hypothetical protein [Pirellula sp.]
MTFRWLAGVLFMMIVSSGNSTLTKAQSINEAAFKKTDQQSCMRIDVDIYAKETAPPLEQYKTYFTETLTIETDHSNSLVKILDRANRTLTIADNQRRVCFVIELESLDSMLAELNALTLKSSRKPETKGDVQVVKGDVVRIENEQVIYEAKLDKGPFNELTLRYLEHVDWSTKIAAVFPPKRPPQIRLALNDYLLEKQSLPVEIRRRTKASRTGDEIVAKLIVPTSPSTADAESVSRILANVQELKIVSAQEYFKQ